MKDKVIVLTGVSSMIGRATAKLFSDCGVHLVLMSRSAKKSVFFTDFFKFKLML